MAGAIAKAAYFTALVACTASAAAASTDRLAVSAGTFTSVRHSPAAVGTLEYRAGYNLLSGDIYLNPMVGILGNTDGGFYGYAGLRVGFPMSSAWHWENAFGFGYYSPGSGPILYDPLEFCLSVSLTRRIGETLGVGIQLFHISNAALRNQDPGANSFLVLVEWPPQTGFAPSRE